MTLMMKIDSVASRPDRAGRHTVRFADNSALRLYRQTVEDFGLYSGMELSETEYQKLLTAAGEMSAKMRAVRIVSASSVSKKDLEQRLIQKGENPQQAKDAVRWMADMDLLDDKATAQQIVHRCVGKGYGLSRAKQALYEKRIPKELWQEVLEGYPDQIEHILSFLETHLNVNSDSRDVRKAVDALLRKGHSYSHIRNALNSLQLQADDYPEEM
jgi:SOS response regulatory protein OraA/RecX